MIVLFGLGREKRSVGLDVELGSDPSGRRLVPAKGRLENLGAELVEA
jgi:hypothetical protein